MGRTQCVLALAALFLGLVHSWDIVISVGYQLEFYTNGINIHNVYLESHPTAITYDEVHNMILFVDKQSDNDAICGYSISSNNIKCFIRRYGSNIHDLAFDPATDKLFFTDYKDRSINWISLKDHGSEQNVHGNLLIKMDDRTPSEIAVDSCTGFIYWTNTQQRRHGNYMERIKFNGYERYVVNRHAPVHSFAFDQQTQKTYFFMGLKHNFLKKVDMKVDNILKHMKMIFYNKPRSAQELTVSKDYLYWTQSYANQNTVWQMLKNASLSSGKPKLIKFNTAHKLSIAANYKIKDQVHGLQDCEALARLLPILETEQTTELNWYKDSTETSDLSSTTDWPTESTESENEQTSDSTSDLDWSTDSTETFDLSSTTDWPTESTESETEQTSDSTSNLDWSTDNIETSDLSSTTDWPTESTESETEQTSDSTSNLDWSTDNIETSDLSSTTDWPTESTETETETTFVSAAELDWSTDSTVTTDLGSTADADWSNNREASDLSSTANADWTTESSEIETEGASDSTTELDGSTYNTETSDLGYQHISSRCEVSACHNYCFQGICSLNEEGQPKCRCNAGYSGARCEVYACHGYCLHNGACSLDQKDGPVCQCDGNHEGTRCEAIKKYTFSYTPQVYSDNRNLTLADLVSNWRKPAVKVSVVVEV